MFSPNTIMVKCQTKPDIFQTKHQSTTKIWIIGIVMCFALCVTIVSIALCIGGLFKDKKIIKESNENDSFIQELYMDASNIINNNKTHRITNIDNELMPRSTNAGFTNSVLNISNDTEENEESNESDEVSNEFNLKKVVYNVMGSIADSAVQQIKETGVNIIKEVITAKSNESQNNTNKTVNILTSIENEQKPIKDRYKIFTIPDTLNDKHKTQISSPDDMIGTVTTNLDLLKEYKNPEFENRKKDDPATGYVQFKDIPEHVAGFLDKFDLDINDRDPYYDQNDYFYSENDEQSYFYDYGKRTWTNFILEKIQEIYNWLTTDFAIDGKGTVSRGNESATIPQILQALNHTMMKGDLSIFIMKIKDIYNIDANIDFDPERSKRIISNTSSVLSFGLLAIDIILLRNIQLMAWEEQGIAKNDALNDPDVFALNSIFMDPSLVKEISENIQAKTLIHNERGSRLIKILRPDFNNSLLSNIDIGFEVASFLSSTIRAGMHLGRAFLNTRDNTRTRGEPKTPSTGLFKMFDNTPDIQKFKDNMKTNELDCLWILYCKNLEKATTFEGPYGFLAKLNSVGLRLLLGELPLNKVVEILIKESLTESKNMNCARLFPKCSSENAAKVVLDNVISNAPKYNIKITATP